MTASKTNIGLFLTKKLAYQSNFILIERFLAAILYAYEDESYFEVNKQLKPPDFFKIRNQSDINNFKDIKYSSNNILGGDNGDSDNNITGKIANIATNTANAVTNAVTNANKQTADTVSDLSTHTYSVLNDTTAHVKSVADQVYDGVSNFFPRKII